MPGGEQRGVDRDDRSSDRMQLAALMLRHGDNLDRIAITADVPVALLELLRNELGEEGPPRINTRPGPRGSGSTLTLRKIVIVLIIDFIAFCNITVCITVLIGHNHTLGTATGVAAVGLLTAAWLLTRRARPGLNRKR